MLFIHHNQGAVRQGREHGEAGSDHQTRLALKRRDPCRRALGLGECTVQHRGRPGGKPDLQCPNKLRRQCNLGYQEERLGQRIAGQHPIDRA